MNKTKILLIAIVILAALLRLYRLDSAPPSLSWDEAAVGYNGWTIANFGRDEYGKFFPLIRRKVKVITQFQTMVGIFLLVGMQLKTCQIRKPYIF